MPHIRERLLKQRITPSRPWAPCSDLLASPADFSLTLGNGLRTSFQRPRAHKEKDAYHDKTRLDSQYDVDERRDLCRIFARSVREERRRSCARE